MSKSSHPQLIALSLLAAALCVTGCGVSGNGLLSPGTPHPEFVVQGWMTEPGPAAEQLAGKVLVLDFWAYWCGPCRAAAPELVSTYERVKDRDVVFLGFTSEGPESINDSREFIESAKIPWPNGYGAGPTFDAYLVEAIPTVYVIGKDGNIFWHDRMSGTVEAAINEALAHN